MKLEAKKVLVVGGTTGMGFAIAKAAIEEGAEVVIASRSKDKVNSAVKKLGEKAVGIAADATNEEDIAKMWNLAGQIDHLVIASASIRSVGFLGSNINDAQYSMDSKFWGPYRIIQNAKIANDGSIILISGLAGRKPSASSAVLSAINSAVEAFGRALALELKPIRVNTICPGTINTEFWETVPINIKDKMFEDARTKLPVGRVGEAIDIANAAIALMTNSFITGIILDVDGGGLLAGQ